eukprot:9120846-Alexandrium_andersonii.AAC.1
MCGLPEVSQVASKVWPVETFLRMKAAKAGDKEIDLDIKDDDDVETLALEDSYEEPEAAEAGAEKKAEDSEEVELVKCEESLADTGGDSEQPWRSAALDESTTIVQNAPNVVLAVQNFKTLV